MSTISLTFPNKQVINQLQNGKDQSLKKMNQTRIRSYSIDCQPEPETNDFSSRTKLERSSSVKRPRIEKREPEKEKISWLVKLNRQFDEQKLIDFEAATLHDKEVKVSRATLYV